MSAEAIPPAAPMPNEPNRPKTAFVFTGGGSLGSMQVGMMRALLAHGVMADMAVGSSVGAMNAAYFAGMPMAEGIEQLATIWRSLRRQDVFPITWRTLTGFILRRDFLVAADGVRKLIDTHVPYRNLEDANIPLYIVATDLLSGETVVLGDFRSQSIGRTRVLLGAGIGRSILLNNLIMLACHCGDRVGVFLHRPASVYVFQAVLAFSERARRSIMRHAFRPGGPDAIIDGRSSRCLHGRCFDGKRAGPVDRGQDSRRAASHRARLCRGNPQARRLGVHLRALRPARLAAKCAFLDPRTGYPGQHQVDDRRRELCAFGAGFPLSARDVQRVPKPFPATSSRR